MSTRSREADTRPATSEPAKRRARTPRPKALIIFPDEWLAYSPTVINLSTHLKEHFDTRIIGIDTGKYRRLVDSRVQYLRVNLLLARILDVLGLYTFLKAFLLCRSIGQYRPDVVIAVDSIGAWTAQSQGMKFHYLSLEVRKDWFFRHVRHESVLSVVIQSPERYAYLFGNAKLVTHIIQNAPTFRGRQMQPRDERALVFFGNAIAKHGLFQCADFIRCCEDWTLTVKGNIPPAVGKQLNKRYSDLLRNGRLVLDDTYLADEDVPSYLGAFHAGFCLYDLSLIDAADFNYMSAPSGKLFNYYAAGVPVVASDIPGLASVSRFRAGVVVSSLSVEQINGALETIGRDYPEFVENCYRAAESFSFTDSVAPFLRSVRIDQVSK